MSVKPGTDKPVNGEEFLNVLVSKVWVYLEKYLNSQDVKDEVLKATKNYVALDLVKLNEPMVFNAARILSRWWFSRPQNESLVFELDTDFKNVQVDMCDTQFGFSFGVSISFTSSARVILNNMNADELPFFQAITIYFTEDPKCDYQFSNVAKLLEMPFVDGTAEDITQEAIHALLVYPNRLTFPVVSGVDISTFRYPPPLGVLRIQVANIDKLTDSHEPFTMPEFYYKLSSCYGTFKSAVKQELKEKKGLTAWTQVVDVVVTEPDLEKIEIKIWEDDCVGDDLVGDVTIKDVSAILFPCTLDQHCDLGAVAQGDTDGGACGQSIFPINGDKTGQATILFEYIPLVDRATHTPIKTLNQKAQPSNRYFIFCYITKIVPSPVQNPKDQPSKLVWALSQDSSQIKNLKSTMLDKSGKYTAPVLTQAFLQTMPEHLNFVFAEDAYDLKDVYAKFSVESSLIKEASFEKPVSLEVKVEKMGVVSLVVRLADLYALGHSM